MKYTLLLLLLIVCPLVTHPLHAFQGTEESVDMEELEIKWQYKTEGSIRGDAVMSQGSLYVGNSAGVLHAIDAETGNQIWSFSTNGAITGAPAVTDNRVIVSSRDNNVYSLDRWTGELLWVFEMNPVLADPNAGWDYFMAAPVVAGDQLLAGSGDGNLYSLDIRSGNLLWKFETNGRIRATPLLHEGIIFQPSNNGVVYALNQQDGSVIWQFATRGASDYPETAPGDRSSIFTRPLIVDDHLIFGSRDGNVYSVNLETHEEAWTFTYGSTWAMSTSISGESVFVGWSTNNLFSAVDLTSGEEKWQYRAGSHVYTTPLVLDSGVVVGSADGYIYKFDAETGELLLSYSVGSEIFSSPLYQNGTLYFGSDDGYFYALEERQDSHRVVYQPENLQGNAQFIVPDQQVAPFLVNAGFDRMGEDELVEFVSQRADDGQPSVIVFALPIIPEALMSPTPQTSIMRRYLEAGGKVIWINGDVPNTYALDEEGNFRRDISDGEALLDVTYLLPMESGNYFGNTTQEGLNWGLPDWLKTTNAIVQPDETITPLVIDEFGQYGFWLKKFNPRPASGFIHARPSAWNVPMREDDLELILELANYGLQ